MSSVGGLVTLIVIVGPTLLRSFRESRLQKKSAPDHPQGLPYSRGLSLSKPANLFVVGSALAIFALNLAALLLPSWRLARSDLFLNLGLPVNTSTSRLRASASGISFDNVEWRPVWGEDGLESLLRKLSSFDGRKLHLLLGFEPFVSCVFCTTTNDFLLFSLIGRLWDYSLHFLLFWIITLHHDTLDILDETIYSLVHFFTAKDLRSSRNSRDSHLRYDRHHMRQPLLYLLGISACAELLVIFGLYEISFGQGRWDHWHSNSRLMWHISLLSALLIVLRSPRIPTLHPMHEIPPLLDQLHNLSNETLAQIQAMHLTQQVLWGHRETRKHVSDWHDARKIPFSARISEEEVSRLKGDAERIAQEGSVPNFDLDSLHALEVSSHEAASNIWASSARNWSKASKEEHRSNP